MKCNDIIKNLVSTNGYISSKGLAYLSDAIQFTK